MESEPEPMHSEAMMPQLRVLSLLVWGQSLVEGGFSLRVGGNRLRHQVGDRVGGLVDGRAVVFCDRGLEAFVGCFHLIVRRHFVRRGVGEDRGGLLLLRRGEAELLGQEIDPMLDHFCRIGRLVSLRVGQCTG